jgi:hypothetical protein
MGKHGNRWLKVSHLHAVKSSRRRSPQNEEVHAFIRDNCPWDPKRTFYKIVAGAVRYRNSKTKEVVDVTF